MLCLCVCSSRFLQEQQDRSSVSAQPLWFSLSFFLSKRSIQSLRFASHRDPKLKRNVGTFSSVTVASAHPSVLYLYTAIDLARKGVEDRGRHASISAAEMGALPYSNFQHSGFRSLRSHSRTEPRRVERRKRMPLDWIIHKAAQRIQY